MRCRKEGHLHVLDQFNAVDVVVQSTPTWSFDQLYLLHWLTACMYLMRDSLLLCGIEKSSMAFSSFVLAASLCR